MKQNLINQRLITFKGSAQVRSSFKDPVRNYKRLSPTNHIQVEITDVLSYYLVNFPYEPQFCNPALSSMMEGAFAACEERDYFPYLVVTPKTSTTSEILKKLEQLEHVDGVLAASFDDSAAIGAAVETLPIHTVIMNKKIAGKVNCVWIDSLNAAETVCHHLLVEGHRKIGFIGGLSGGFNAAQRLEGYLSALRSFDVVIDSDLIKEVGYTFLSGYEASKVLLKKSQI